MQTEVSDLMNIKIRDTVLEKFGMDFQTQLAPALELMSSKIHQPDINQVRSLGYVNPIMSASTSQGLIVLKGLEDWVNLDLINLSANIDSR